MTPAQRWWRLALMRRRDLDEQIRTAYRQHDYDTAHDLEVERDRLPHGRWLSRSYWKRIERLAGIDTEAQAA